MYWPGLTSEDINAVLVETKAVMLKKHEAKRAGEPVPDVATPALDAAKAKSMAARAQMGLGSTLITAPPVQEVVLQKSRSALMAAAPPANERLGDDLTVRIVKPRKSKLQMAEEAKANAGARWFNMPKTNLTPELKRDYQLLAMRSTLDSKRFYKKDDSRSAVPEYSQVGTMIEGPTEYFSSRMTKKERKRTLADEILDEERETKKLRAKYNEIQKVKTSGKKGDYKKAMQKRYGTKRA